MIIKKSTDEEHFYHQFKFIQFELFNLLWTTHCLLYFQSDFLRLSPESSSFLSESASFLSDQERVNTNFNFIQHFIYIFDLFLMQKNNLQERKHD